MLGIDRYPPTNDQSLKAWSAADELILNYVSGNQITSIHPILFNDRFGYLTCHLHASKPQTVINYKSQEKAILQNLSFNGLAESTFVNPLLNGASHANLGVIKIPKSLDLFRLQLHQLHSKLDDAGIVICGFMTKYFTPQLIKIAGEYFEIVEQTKAWKKARLILLSNKKKLPKFNVLEQFDWNKKTYKQYLGVFSSGHIDYATQFFLDHLNIPSKANSVLDLASGNGVIACFVRASNPSTSIYLVDDSWLAIESSKLNLNNGDNHFHYDNTLENIDNSSLDLVLSNPPFHFDFEPNLEITYSLFTQVKQKLKSGGKFSLVANRHLPYKPYLEGIFSKTEIVSQNNHFVIYSCTN